MHINSNQSDYLYDTHVEIVGFNVRKRVVSCGRWSERPHRRDTVRESSKKWMKNSSCIEGWGRLNVSHTTNKQIEYQTFDANCLQLRQAPELRQVVVDLPQSSKVLFWYYQEHMKNTIPRKINYFPTFPLCSRCGSWLLVLSWIPMLWPFCVEHSPSSSSFVHHCRCRWGSLAFPLSGASNQLSTFEKLINYLLI